MIVYKLLIPWWWCPCFFFFLTVLTVFHPPLFSSSPRASASYHPCYSFSSFPLTAIKRSSKWLIQTTKKTTPQMPNTDHQVCFSLLLLFLIYIDLLSVPWLFGKKRLLKKQNAIVEDQGLTVAGNMRPADGLCRPRVFLLVCVQDQRGHIHM